MENQDTKPILIEISDNKKFSEANIYSFAKETLRKTEASFAWQPHTDRLMEEYVLEDLENLSFELTKGDESQ